MYATMPVGDITISKKLKNLSKLTNILYNFSFFCMISLFYELLFPNNVKHIISKFNDNTSITHDYSFQPKNTTQTPSPSHHPSQSVNREMIYTLHPDLMTRLRLARSVHVLHLSTSRFTSGEQQNTTQRWWSPRFLDEHERGN